MSLISLRRLMNRLTRLRGHTFTSVHSCYPLSRRHCTSRRIFECRPLLEALEDRCVPTAFVVSNTLDAGAGSLNVVFGILLPVWVFYMAFEAYHTARKRLAGEPVDEYSSIINLGGRPDNAPVAGIVLLDPQFSPSLLEITDPLPARAINADPVDVTDVKSAANPRGSDRSLSTRAPISGRL